MSLRLTPERDVAAEWNIPLEQFRLLRRRHNWAHVRFSRQDIRYTDGQLEQIVHDMTTSGARMPKAAATAGQTTRSARRSA